MHKELEKHDGAGIIGKWTVEMRDCTGVPLADQKPGVGRLVSKEILYNKTPSVALQAYALQSTTDQTYDLGITYGEVGTDPTLPDASDTTLGSSTVRVAVATHSATGGVGTIEFFLNTSQGNAHLYEMGLFGDGGASQATATQGTGILFSRVNIDKNKTSSYSLTCTFTMTFASLT